MNSADAIERIASAVLYEGFMLYPYRLSSVKNQHRWNFGVLYPEPYCQTCGERSFLQTECLVRADAGAVVGVKVRWLQMEGEGVGERDAVADVRLGGVGAEKEIGEKGVKARVIVRAEKLKEKRAELPNGTTHANALQAGLYGPVTWRITVRVENLGRYESEMRDEALGLSLISTHVILSVEGGMFLSVIDPPVEWREAAEACENIGVWPVLVGDDSQMLAAPIVLYDHPQIAAQSPGDLYDGTEIDEILTLRIQTLTDGEKTEVRSTDARVRAMLERSEALTRDELMKLHAPMHRERGRLFKKGDQVRLRPRRRADIFDIALTGKLATVQSVEQDFENTYHVCVTVDDDPGKDLGMEGKPGHRFFFGADEVEPA